MLATLTSRVFSDRNFIYERKLDGERCLAIRNTRGVRLLSRNRKRLNETYPEVVEALEKQRAGQFVLDGEIVAFEGRATSFSRLQKRFGIKNPEEARRSGIPVFYYVFDVLDMEGYDLTRLPLTQRKAILRQAVSFTRPLRFSAHRKGDAESFFKEACRKGWEGLIAKRADSAYVPTRSANWLKFKCAKRQELVIGGYTDPQGPARNSARSLWGSTAAATCCMPARWGRALTKRPCEAWQSAFPASKRRGRPSRQTDCPRGVCIG